MNFSRRILYFIYTTFFSCQECAIQLCNLIWNLKILSPVNAFFFLCIFFTFSFIALVEASLKRHKMAMKQSLVEIDCGERDDVNVILGMAHFIKTVDDLHLCIVNNCPDALFAVAFCEASGDKKLRYSGTDDELIKIATDNAMKIGCGHSFLIVVKEPLFPLHILPAIKSLNTVTRVFAATANPLQVVVVENEKGGRGIIGVIDGDAPKGGVETKDDQAARREFLTKIGYKL